MRGFCVWIFVLIASCALCKASFRSQTDAGSVYINDYGQISCDDVICPQGTFKCRIVRASIRGTRNMSITRTCLDTEGKVLMEEKKDTLAPYEGFNAYVEADRNGNIISDGQAWSPEAAVQLQQRIGQQTQQIQKQVNDQLSQVLYNLNNNLQNTFANIFGR